MSNKIMENNTTTPTNTKSSAGLTASLLVLVVALIGLNIFLYLQNQKLSKQISQLKSNQDITPAPLATPTPQEDEKSSTDKHQKFVTNTFLGISLQFPQELVVDDYNPEAIFVRLEDTIPSGTTNTGGGFLGYSPYKLSINLADNQTSVDTNVQESLQSIKQSFDIKEWKVENSTMVAFPGKILTGPCEGYCRSIFFKAPNSKIYHIEEIYGNQDEYKKYQTFGNQILSTFKFVDNQSTGTNGLYSNPSLGVEFKYPSAFKFENVSGPEKFEGMTEGVWSVTFKSQKKRVFKNTQHDSTRWR